MIGQESRLSFAVLEEAADWFARLRSGEAGTQERADWQRWFDASAEHRAAWSQVDAISRRFETFRSPPEQNVAARILRTHRGHPSRRQLLTGLLAATGAGLLGWGSGRGMLPESLLARVADCRTGIGEIRRFALADGGVVWLNTDSALDFVTPSRARLLSGEVLVEPPAHVEPFTLEVGRGVLVASGARFAARRDGDDTTVSVFAGAVDIRVADNPVPRRLHQGRELSLGRAGFHRESPVRLSRAAWAQGLLLAEDLPLRELIRELSRYRAGHLAVAPEVAELRVIGGYPLRDTDQVLVMLEQSLPIRVRRVLPWWVTIEARA